MARYLIGNVKGPQGLPGKDGVSPTAKVVQTDSGATLTVTDASGTTTAQIKNGESRSDYDLAVQNGFVGTPAEWLESLKAVTPYVTVEQSGDNAVITAIDANGTTTATVSAGGSYRAGAGIDITDGVISATDAIDIDLSGYATETYVNNMISEIETQIINPYVAGDGIAIGSDNNEISVDKTVVATKTDLAAKQDTLTAGENIKIENNVISAVGGGEGHTYTAGAGIDITNDEISVDNTVALKTDIPDVSNFVEASDLATVATSGSYADLSNKPTIPTIPTNVSAFTNDAGYITSYTETDPVFSASPAYGITQNDIDTWDGKSDFSGSYTDLTNKPDLSGFATTSALTSGLAAKQDTLTAGTNITIDANNVISATGGSEIYKFVALDAQGLIGVTEKFQNGEYITTLKRGRYIFTLSNVQSDSYGTTLMYTAYDGNDSTGKAQVWPILSISYNTDKTFNNASISLLKTSSQADGIHVDAEDSVTGAGSTVGSDLYYIKNYYAKKTDIPDEVLPTIASGDAGKVLAVNSTEDGTEWIAAGGGGGSSYTWTDEVYEIPQGSSLDSNTLADWIEHYNQGNGKIYPIIHYNGMYHRLARINDYNGWRTFTYTVMPHLRVNGSLYQYLQYYIDLKINLTDFTSGRATAGETSFPTPDARGISVPYNMGVSGAMGTVADNFYYVKNNYATKAEIPTTSARAASSLFLKDTNNVVYQITVDTAGNLVATAQA